MPMRRREYRNVGRASTPLSGNRPIVLGTRALCLALARRGTTNMLGQGRKGPSRRSPTGRMTSYRRQISAGPSSLCNCEWQGERSCT